MPSARPREGVWGAPPRKKSMVRPASLFLKICYNMDGKNAVQPFFVCWIGDLFFTGTGTDARAFVRELQRALRDLQCIKSPIS